MKITGSVSEVQPTLLLLHLPQAIIRRIFQECTVNSLGALFVHPKKLAGQYLRQATACGLLHSSGDSERKLDIEATQSSQIKPSTTDARTDYEHRSVGLQVIAFVTRVEGNFSPKTASHRGYAKVRGDYVLLGLEQGAVEVWELGFGQCVCVLVGLEEHAPAVSLDAQGAYVVALGEDSVACSWEIPEYVLPKGVGGPPYARAASAATPSCYSTRTYEEDPTAQGYRWHPGDPPVELQCWTVRELPADGVLLLTEPRAPTQGGQEIPELQTCQVQGAVVVSSTGTRVHPDAYHVHTCPDFLHLRSFSVDAHASRFDREHCLLSACIPDADDHQWTVTTVDLYTGDEVARFSSADVVWGEEVLQPEQCTVTDLFCGEAHVLVEIDSFILILWDLSPCLDTSSFPYQAHRKLDPTSLNDPKPGPVMISLFELDVPFGLLEMGEYVHGVAFDVPRLVANRNAAVFVVTDWSDLFNNLSEPRNSFRFWDGCTSSLLSVVSLRYDASNTLIDLVRFDPSLAGEGTATAVLAMDAVDGSGMGLAVWTTPNRNPCNSDMLAYSETRLSAEPETVFYPEQAGNVGKNCPKRLLGGEAVIEYPSPLLHAQWDTQTLITDASW
eukprot:CAMPEP_0114286316 /NCGR_PEP_ID=MMETSP0059-20121206/5689_1 /TAXON_ID=36894 /ORGANISM="Pyramimonas parkeae, Strain CCMP726" /LENGTH=612 /DNA_ID=CAMNT_0001407341 /DNA_START=280 /DNA_END=2117 /DNA_ORIENTATION=-